MSYQQDKYDLGRTIGRRYIEPLKTQSIDEPDNNVKRIVVSRNSSNDDKLSKKSTWSDDSGHSASTIHLAKLNYPANASGSISNQNGKPFNWRDLPSNAVLKIERPHFRLPNKPSLLKKLSDSSYVLPDETNNQSTSVQYTGAELRSQLPWSYFGAQSDALKPKKSFIELREGEDLPPVPVPDYTMNLSRKEPRAYNHENRKSSAAAPPKRFINPKKGTTLEHKSR